MTTQEEIYKKYVGSRVDIGTPHFDNPKRLFFFVGLLIEVNNEYLLLDTNKGIRKINLADVFEFKSMEA